MTDKKKPLNEGHQPKKYEKGHQPSTQTNVPTNAKPPTGSTGVVPPAKGER